MAVTLHNTVVRALVDQAGSMYFNRGVFQLRQSEFLVLSARVSLSAGDDANQLFIFVAFNDWGHIYYKSVIKEAGTGLAFFDEHISFEDEPDGSRHYYFSDVIERDVVRNQLPRLTSDPSYVYTWGGWEITRYHHTRME